MRVAVKTDDYCPRCWHLIDAYEEPLCTAGVVARPPEVMRHPDSPCGTAAERFLPREGARRAD